MKYIENQLAWLAFVPFGTVIIFLILAYGYQWGSEPIPQWAFLMILPLFIFLLLMFFKMKTSVDRKQIVISYGIGLVKKRIKIRDIEDIKVARNKWYYGLGIRIIKGGILYNIHTLNGIELRFKEKKSFIRIGSRTPDRLISEINKRIKYADK